MSYFNFLAAGPQGHQRTYCRDYYPEDVVLSTATTRQYNGAITDIKEDLESGPAKKTVMIDNAVKVTTIADKFRGQMQNFWSSLKKECKITFSVTLIGGISAAIAAVALTALLPPLWPIAVGVSFVALALLGFSTWNYCRGVQAVHELKQWKDPLPGILQERKNAEKLGFHHCYVSQNKGKIVSEEELKDIWFKSMDKHADSFTRDPKVIRTFMEQAPVKAGALDYAFDTTSEYDTEEVKFLRTLGGKFTPLDEHFQALRKHTETLKEGIKIERSRAILQNDMQLERDLAPYKLLINSKKLELQSRKDRLFIVIDTYEKGEMIRSHQRTSPAYRPSRVVPGSGLCSTRASVPLHVQAARNELNNINCELNEVERVYRAMTAPVRHLHEKNKRCIDQWAVNEIRRIQRGEDTALLNLYTPVNALLLQYKNRNDTPEPKTVEANSEIDINIKPKAPELDEDFTPPSYDPTWIRVVGEVDWKNAIVKETTLHKNGKVSSKETHYRS